MVKTLLIVECSTQLNWYDIFAEYKVLPWGEELVVEQAEWNDLSLTSYHDGGVMVNIRRANRPLPDTPQVRDRCVKVDFVLLRSVTRGITGQDSRNLLMGLIHGNIPSINSLESAYVCLERPTVFGALKGIETKLKSEGIEFPLINQNLYPNFREMIITPEFPVVGKIGHAHAGFGKMKIKSSEEMADFKSILALHKDYVTLEPFVEWDYDMRIQKIGDHYRGFRRMSPNWKGNTGNASVIEDMEVTPQHKRWVDECAKLFGGMEILGLDLLHSKKTGKDYILELNDTAIGLVHKYEEEDMQFIRDIVLTRMNLTFAPKKPKEETGESSTKESSETLPQSNADNSSDELQQLREKVALLEVQLANEKKKVEELTKSSNAAGKKKNNFFGF